MSSLSVSFLGNCRRAVSSRFNNFSTLALELRSVLSSKSDCNALASMSLRMSFSLTSDSSFMATKRRVCRRSYRCRGCCC